MGGSATTGAVDAGAAWLSTAVGGGAGGGVVKVSATGAGVIETIELDPKALLQTLGLEETQLDPDDVETLQDLILIAVREASEKASKIKEERMRELTGGMGMPGMF